MQLLLEQMQTLSMEERELLVLRYLLGWRVKDIGAHLNIVGKHNHGKDQVFVGNITPAREFLFGTPHTPTATLTMNPTATTFAVDEQTPPRNPKNRDIFQDQKARQRWSGTGKMGDAIRYNLCT